MYCTSTSVRPKWTLLPAYLVWLTLGYENSHQHCSTRKTPRNTELKHRIFGISNLPSCITCKTYVCNEKYLYYMPLLIWQILMMANLLCLREPPYYIFNKSLKSNHSDQEEHISRGEKFQIHFFSDRIACSMFSTHLIHPPGKYAWQFF